MDPSGDHARHHDQSRTIRLPVHLYGKISRIKKTTKVLSQEFGRKPTEEEIAESMEMTIEKLRFIAKSAQLPISLETPIGKEEDSRLGGFIKPTSRILNRMSPRIFCVKISKACAHPQPKRARCAASALRPG